MAKTVLNKETTSWVEIDVTALKGADKAAYEKMRSANKAASEARQAFEGRVVAKLRTQERLPAGKVPFFTHRFGRSSMAVDKADGALLVQDAPSASGTREKHTFQL